MTYAMTYRQAVYHGACEIVDTIGEILGGWDAYGKDTPVPLVDVLDMSELNERSDYRWESRDAAEWAFVRLAPREMRRLGADYDTMATDLANWDPGRIPSYEVFERWYTAHLRMILGGRIRPGYWRAGNGWRSC